MTEQTSQDWFSQAAAIVTAMHNARKTSAKDFYAQGGSERAQALLRQLDALRRRVEPLIVAVHV